MKIEEFVNEYLKEHRHDILLNPYDDLIEFTELFLSELMKDAGKAIVENWNPDPHPEITIPLNPNEFVSGDKARIVVLKAEEE